LTPEERAEFDRLLHQGDRRWLVFRGAALAIQDATDKEIIVVGPAGTGKSLAILAKLHDLALTYPGFRGLILRQTRDSLTDSGLVTFEEKVLPPDSPVGRGPKRKQRHAYHYPNGSTITVGGVADKPTRLFSTEYDVIYVQECNEISEDAWESLTRALRNNRMPYQQIIGDMNPTHEMHWCHRRCDEGQTRELLSQHRDNPGLTAEYLNTLSRMTGSRRERLFEGKRVVDIDGAYFARLIYDAKRDGRVMALPVSPKLLVDTSWDFGVSDLTTIWFWQPYGMQRLAIDYYEMSGEGLGHYARVMQRKAQRFGYTYGTIYLPHDADARVQAVEAESRRELLGKLLPGVRIVVVPRVHDLADKIEHSRNLIPVTWFDTSRAPQDDPEARNAATGMQHLIAYKREFNAQTGTYGARPRHDIASHAASSFGEYAMGFRPVGGERKAPSRRTPNYMG